MFGLTPNQLYGLGAIVVAVIGYLLLTYRQEFGGVAGWFGGLFKSKTAVPTTDADAIRKAIDTLYKHPDAEVKRLAALVAKRVTEVAYPVADTVTVRTAP